MRLSHIRSTNLIAYIYQLSDNIDIIYWGLVRVEDNKKKKPFYKKWWFWLVDFLVLGFEVVQSSDHYVDTEEDEDAEKTDDQEKEEKKEKDDSDKEEQAKTDEEERKENRTTAEAIEEDSSNVDEADIDGDELVLKYNPGTVWDENSFMSTVYEMFKDVKVAFDDEDINSVQVMIETEMTDEKGNEETETIIKYNYKIG